MKCATTIEEQIQLLKDRNMIISDDAKAKEILFDIGYYRLGFYWFPFEQSNKGNNRKHTFKPSTKFEDIIKLYYFDQDLRNCLAKYLFRIEVDFRTNLVYTVSNHYKNNPIWFADDRCVTRKFIEKLEKTQGIYDNIRSKNAVIKNHHSKYRNDRYAPAWKTIEFMTFGEICMLYGELTDKKLKQKIASRYGIEYVNIFTKYLHVIRILRNGCAHGRNIYDIHLDQFIANDSYTNIQVCHNHNINGILQVVFYILRHISENREKELKECLRDLINKNKSIEHILQSFNGLSS